MKNGRKRASSSGMPLRLPDLDAVGIFLLGNMVHGGDELHRAGFALHLALQAFDVGQQPPRGKGGEVALREFGLGGAEFGAELAQALFGGGES